jgi:Leucine-rich repeat (LRR) protein
MKILSTFLILVLFIGSFAFAQDICSRTPAIRNALEQQFQKPCDSLSSEDLASFEGPLNLSNQALFDLQKNDFQGLTSLQKLYLYNNRLRTLPDGVFADLISLQYLDLSANQLINLPDGIFQTLEGLQTLHLQHNQIPKISTNIFSPENFSTRAKVSLQVNPLSIEAKTLLKDQLQERVIY